MNDAIQRFIASKGYPRFDLRAALIDMDGTLYDSMPRHAEAWRRMMLTVGVDLPVEEYFLHEGRTGATTIRLLMERHAGRIPSDEETARLYKLKTEYFASMPEVKVMPGAARMLRELEKAGVKRVLVTGSGQSSLISRLDTDFPGAFASDMRVTALQTRRGKPAPDPYLAGLRLAGVKPWQAIVIENAPLGVESGAAAGIVTAGITTGPIPQSALAEAGATLTFPSMPEFADFLPGLLSDYAAD